MMTDAVEALRKALKNSPAAEARPGQELMCAEVERSFREGNHLLVEAGTGTGKSLAYLVPSILFASGEPRKRVVVATATKALQEQLINKDLPFLESSLGEEYPFKFAMLKGRSNYACLAKINAIKATPSLFGLLGEENLDLVAQWVSSTDTGDRSEVSFPSALWSEISVDPGECPGAAACPFASGCFSEKARAEAASSDLVVVNSALYAAHLAAGGTVLHEHDAVVFDEAHTLEDIVAQAFGVTISSSRIGRLASLLKTLKLLKTSDSLRSAATALELELESLPEESFEPFKPPFSSTLERVRDLCVSAHLELLSVDTDDTTSTIKLQAVNSNTSLLSDLIKVLDPASYGNAVAYPELGRRPVLRLTPVDAAPIIASSLLGEKSVVFTSATLASGGKFDIPARRLGLTLETADDVRPSWRSGIVASPFDYPRQGLLYLPDMPSVKDPEFMNALVDELILLAQASEGRTLALFTSRRAMNEATQLLRMKSDFNILPQDELPRTDLLEAFTSSKGSIITATQGFWTGLDIPGDDLIHVCIDRIPFPRPNDPLQSARRAQASKAGLSAFYQVDIPVATRLLAQGSGRLIRTASDRGVVTFFDKRISDASYGNVILKSIPPFRRTRDRSLVLRGLQQLSSSGN